MEPIALEQCELLNKKKPDQGYVMYPSGDKPCFRHAESKPSPEPPGPNERVVVVWSPSTRPGILRGFSAEAYQVDGRMQYMAFDTNGINTQDSDLASLIEKFGTPALKQVEDKQNRFGATFQSHSVTWILEPDIAVSFVGTTSSLDKGRVLIGTSAGQKAYNDFQAYLLKLLNPRGSGL